MHVETSSWPFVERAERAVRSLHVDWILVTSLALLTATGLAMIYSTTYDPVAGRVGGEFSRQFYAAGIGVVAMIACMSIDYRRLADASLVVYVLVAAALIYVLVFGVTAGGARRWIDLRLMRVQPSEFAKIALALVLATFFADTRRSASNGRDLAIGAVFLAVLAGLVAKEPDLGTAVTLVSILFGISIVAGLRLKYLGIIAVVAVVSAPVAWAFALQDYQKERIETFLDPEQDARGAGYQQIQARITAGSGGLTGKGFRQGTQGQYKFLPVAHNDFVYSVLAEELGFLGVLATLGLYLVVILRSLEAARLSQDRLGTYLVVGLVSWFTFQVLYNITMSAGLAPVKGLTLPLMSYGGSSIIATLASFGLILNVRMRRYVH